MRLAAGWRPAEKRRKVNDEALRSLVAEGLTIAQLAARAGMDYSSVRRRVRALDLVGPGIRPRPAKVPDAALLSLRRAGLSDEEIAARTGLKVSSVAARLGRVRRHGGLAVSAQELAYYRVHIREALREGAAVCLECGGLYHMLGHHVLRQHGLGADTYREKWGYNRQTGLSVPALRERARRRALAMPRPPGAREGLQKAREALRRLAPLPRRLESRLAQRDAGKARVAAGWRPPWWKGVDEEPLRKLVAEGLTFREIAARTGLQYATARKRIRALGLLGPGIGPARPRITDADLLALRRAGLWAREIAACTGLKGQSIRHRLWKLRRRGVGVPPPPARSRANPRRRITDEQLLAFVRQGLRRSEIAARVGVTPRSVSARLVGLRRRGLLASVRRLPERPA